MTLDSFRWGVAVLSLGTFPAAIAFWLIVHPFVGLWRRLGPAATYTMLGLVFALNVAVAWRWRASLLDTPLPSGPLLWTSAAIAYAVAIVLELQCRRHLKLRTLVGMPELRPDAGEPVLLQNGIYGRVRHPRYLSVAFGALAMALFCHDPVIWILFAAAVPGLVAIVHFEELELRDRFGARYDEYARRVPRFIPRIG